MLPIEWARADDWRSFTSRDGRELIARVVNLTDDEVVLERKSDLKVFTIARSNFSEADQEYLHTHVPGEGKKGVNEPELGEPDGALSFEKVDPSIADYFPDLSENKTHEAQHFPMGPLGGMISVRMGEDEAKVLSLMIGGPADAAGVKAGDMLISAGGDRFDALSSDPATGGDGVPRQLGEAILEAQAGGLALQLDVRRDDEKVTLEVELPQAPVFAKEFPIECDRSSLLEKAACDWLARAHKKHGNFGHGDRYSNAFAALALLSSGNPDYRFILRDYAKRTANLVGNQVDNNNWRSSAMGIFLAEYYLATGDESMLEPLQKCCEALARRVDPATGRLGHGGTDLPYDGKGLVITSAHFHHLWALASAAGIPMDEAAWDLSYRSVEASIGGEGNVGYNFSATGSSQSMARTGLVATALEIGGQSSSDKRGMYDWLADNVKRATNGHTVTSMGMVFGFMGTKNAGKRAHRDCLDYHRWLFALVTPVNHQQGSYYYGLRTNIGGDGYLGFRTVGNYVTALSLTSAKSNTLWSFGNREKRWYLPK